MVAVRRGGSPGLDPPRDAARAACKDCAPDEPDPTEVEKLRREVADIRANLEFTRDKVAEQDVRTTRAEERLDHVESRVGCVEADVNDMARGPNGGRRG